MGGKMSIFKNIFYGLFPKYDTRPIAQVYYVDFVNRKLINKETYTRFIYSDKIVYKQVA